MHVLIGLAIKSIESQTERIENSMKDGTNSNSIERQKERMAAIEPHRGSKTARH